MACVFFLFQVLLYKYILKLYLMKSLSLFRHLGLSLVPRAGDSVVCSALRGGSYCSDGNLDGLSPADMTFNSALDHCYGVGDGNDTQSTINP